MVQFLLVLGCSIFHKDLVSLRAIHACLLKFSVAQKGRTAEEVAMEGGHCHIAELLAKERLEAPGQLLHVDETTGCTVWIGDEVCVCVCVCMYVWRRRFLLIVDA